MAKSRKRRPREDTEPDSSKEHDYNEEVDEFIKAKRPRRPQKPRTSKPKKRREKRNEFRRSDEFKKTKAYRNQLNKQRICYRAKKIVKDSEYYAS